jgi:hypothetical protein
VNAADRWFPDSYVFALAVVVLVGLAAILHGASPLSVSRAFGDGFWTLIPFTLQMAHVAIGGYIVATSPAAAKIMRWLARRPSSGRSAVVFVGVLSIFLSFLNWGLAVAVDTPAGNVAALMPCGACLQVLTEFMPPDGKVLIAGSGKYSLKDLLPHSFALPAP